MKPTVTNILTDISSSKKIELAKTDDLSKLISRLEATAKEANSAISDISANGKKAEAMADQFSAANDKLEKLEEDLKQLQADRDDAEVEESEAQKDLGYFQDLVRMSIDEADDIKMNLDNGIVDVENLMAKIEQQAKELGVKPSNIKEYAKAKSKISQFEDLILKIDLEIRSVPFGI